jgi:hypothetical protein
MSLVQKSTFTGRYFCAGVDAITAYLGTVYGVSSPHP